MKILVTGYKGFIGQNMVKSLRDDNHDVVTYTWGDEIKNWNLDLVIHLGAISETNETNVDLIMLKNYEFTINLIQSCERHKIPVQYASSASIYGNRDRGTAFKETDSPNPRSPYAWSKYMIDRFVLNRSWNTIVQGFRYFNVYGPHEDHKKQPSPFEAFKRQSIANGIINVFEGSEEIYRDFVPVERVIEVHKRFFNINKSGIWNVGTGKPRSFMEIAKSISKERNSEIKIIPMPEDLKPGYQYYSCADLTKLNYTLSGVV